MIVFTTGLLLFLGVHSIRMVAGDWRARQLVRLGRAHYKGLYTLASLAGFGLMIWGFGIARADPRVLWTPPGATRYLVAALTLPAFILIAAAYVPGNRIKATVGHPMLLGTMIWALGHLLGNGTLVDTLLFGGFFLWAAADFRASLRRDRSTGAPEGARGRGRGALTVVAGGIAWAAFAAWGHAWLIGVQPFGS